VKDIIIIGSGPAGLTAAIYAKRAGWDTLVIEKNTMSGGQIINTADVDNYPGLPGINGFEMGMKFREHAETVKAEFVSDQVVGVTKQDGFFEVIGEKETYQAACVIVATGATHALLGAEGEKEFTGRGVSYCATCDGAFFRNKTVAVIGGGDVAVEEAILLSKLCKEVYVVHRRDELRSAKILQEKLFSLKNIKIFWNCTVEKILGNEQVEKILLADQAENKTMEIAVDGVFIAVGMRPETEKFTPLLETDKIGYIVADESCATNIVGIYAAGDVRTKRLRQVVTAVSDGANAVASATEYLNNL